MKNEVKIFLEDKNEEVIYDLGPNVPAESVKTLTETIENSNKKELELINPIVGKLSEIQSLKELKYDAENKKESVDAYKKAKKDLTAFSKNYKEMKEILKRPHIEYNKKVDAIYNFFDNEKTNCLNALNLNFDEYLKEEEEKKAEAERKKKAEELKKIEELQRINNEQQAKINNQKIQTRIIELDAKVKGIVFDISASINHLNKEGLEQLASEQLTKPFESLFNEFNSDNLLDSLPDDSEHKKALDKIKDDYEKALKSSQKSIKNAIEKIEAEDKVKQLESENKVLETQNKALEATQPNSLLSDENDLPFQKATSPAIGEVDDLQKLSVILSDLTELKNVVVHYKNNISNVSFNDEQLNPILDIIVNKSFPQLVEWTEKLESWTANKIEKYKQLK